MPGSAPIQIGTLPNERSFGFYSDPVRPGGQTVWDGTVHVFDLAGHPKATRAYAWSYELPDGKRRFFAVLHADPIKSPRDAVRAAIVAEARATSTRKA